MAQRNIPVAFDVLGTCFDIRGAVGPLRSSFPTLQPEPAAAVIDDWFHSAQRDFTCALQYERAIPFRGPIDDGFKITDLSMNGAYRSARPFSVAHGSRTSWY